MASPAHNVLKPFFRFDFGFDSLKDGLDGGQAHHTFPEEPRGRIQAEEECHPLLVQV